MRAAAGRARRHRSGHAVVAPLGGALQAGVRGGAGRAHAVRYCAGRRRGRPALPERSGAGRHRIPWLRDRRPRGRRRPGSDVRRARLRARPARRRQAPLPDGRRQARRYRWCRRARDRHVRLRDANPQRTPRRGVHPLRQHQPAQCAARRRSATAG